MMRFVFKRLAHSLFLVVAASLLSFSILHLAPGDFFDAMRLNPEISRATLEANREQHGLHGSVVTQYSNWVRSGLKGEWGFSFAYNSPAGPILWYRAKNTLLLAGAATLLAWLVALPAGMWIATKTGTWASAIADGVVSALLATPELILALLLLLFAVRSGYLPAGGLRSLNTVDISSSGFASITDSKDVARHLVLPALCLTAGLLPLLLLHIIAALRESLASSFVLAARGYGIPFHRVVLRHALPAAAPPLISLLGLSLGLLMSSTLLIESIFSWPGLGQLMLDAILQRDLFVILDAGMLATTLLIAGNFLADVLLYASDPRIRAN